MLLYNSLYVPFPHSNSRHVHFNLTFQFQMLLQFSALNRDLVITCVRSGLETMTGWQLQESSSRNTVHILPFPLIHNISECNFWQQSGAVAKLFYGKLRHSALRCIVYMGTLQQLDHQVQIGLEKKSSLIYGCTTPIGTGNVFIPLSLSNEQYSLNMEMGSPAWQHWALSWSFRINYTPHCWLQ